MRKLIPVLLIVLLLLSGCAASAPAESASNDLQIVTTIFPPYDFAKNIGGEAVSVTMLAPPGTEAHDFVPSLTEVNLIANCDLFLYIGGDIDPWAADVLESLGEAAPRAIRLMDHVELLHELPLECVGEEDHHDHDHSGEAIDGHIWTDPANAIALCEAITAAMSELDPAQKNAYEENLSLYRTELESLRADFAAVMETAQRNSIVFADRMPFRYLAEALELDCYAAFQGCSADTEPSLATIAFLTETIETKSIPVVFYLENSDQTVADTLSAATGAEKRLLHSCHNVSQSELDAGLGYVELMRANVQALQAALQ